MGAEILDAVVERVALAEHDGRSGVPLERVVLADGTRLIVKRGSPEDDIGAIASHDTTGRELQLWRDGVLDRLPEGVGHAIVDAWDDAGVVTTVMRDLGDAVPAWTTRVPKATCRRVLDATASVHRAMRGEQHPALCTLMDRIALMSPAAMGRATQRFPLVRAILEGWAAFHEVVPADVVAAVDAVHADPRPLAGAFAARPCTLLHGDLVYVNLAVTDHEIVLLDWNLATWGPPALDLSFFITGGAGATDATHDEIVDEYRAAAGADLDEVALALTMFQGLLDLGWNKAFDALHHEDPDKRAMERADLDWWVAQARTVLDAGIVPV